MYIAMQPPLSNSLFFGVWSWYLLSGPAFSVKTLRATPSGVLTPKASHSAGFSAKPNTPWLKPLTMSVGKGRCDCDALK